MQLRMIGRRSLSGSMTVVGDIAQATGPWAPATWAQVVEHLPARRGWRLVELTVNYRTPAEIMELAGRVLAQVAPGMRPPEAVRATGFPPRIVRADPPADFDGSGLTRVASTVVAEESAAVGNGTVGVLAPASLVDRLEHTLATAGVTVGRVGRGALDEPISLLSIDDAKGLEFDAVVVVEPDRIARETTQGYHGLYVALTRATQRLALVHSVPLPAAMTSAESTSA